MARVYRAASTTANLGEFRQTYRQACLSVSLNLGSEGMTSTIRRTQPERVEAMRNRLLDASVECLAETGYTGFSTNDVVRRAGVSRGALAHHFPTKADLVAAVADRLITLRAAEFRQRFAGIPAPRRTVAEALDVLWTFFDDASFHALLELIVAARTDPELRPVLARGTGQALEVTREVFVEVFPDLSTRPFLDEVLEAVLALFTGLAAQAVLGDDGAHRQAAVRHLLKLALTAAPDFGKDRT
jgi:AcrR family transcriptional regulator